MMSMYTRAEIRDLIDYLEGLDVLNKEGRKLPLFQIINARAQIEDHYLYTVLQDVTAISGPRLCHWDSYVIIDILEGPFHEIPLWLNITPLSRSTSMWRLRRGK